MVLVGYQAKGTAGRSFYKGDDEVPLDDEIVKVRARIHRLGGYSAHADSEELSHFVKNIKGLKLVRIVHGEPKSPRAFKERLLRCKADLQVGLAFESAE